MAEKSSYDDNSKTLRYLKDDLIVFQFVANGDEGDKFIKVYRSHIIPVPGKEFSDARYCPIQSGEPDLSCPLCEQGHTDIKERMSMWLYVYNILHTTMPKDKAYPVAPYEGRNYFNEEVNDFRIWHASAWRDSPWADILKNAEIYKGLHNFTANLVVVGEKLSRRYKMYALPNSPMFTPELYAKAHEECEPIPDILKAQISSPVQLNPQQSTQTSQPSSVGQPQGVNVGPPTPVGPAAGAASIGPGAPTMQTPQALVVPPAQPEEDESRPLKKLF